jgi:plasmid stabilization system protein ParE
MRIIVDERADEKIQETAKYILEMFGRKARQGFRREFHRVVKLLSKNPNIGPAEPFLADAPVMYRSIVVNRLNKIVYWINDDVIEIVDFWDTRREPEAQAKQVK